VSKKNSLKKSSEDDIEGLRVSGATPFQILEMKSPVFTTLEDLVVGAYGGISGDGVNETRKRLFSQKNVSIDRLPPSRVRKKLILK
jgi:hypothetical protein